MVKYNPLFMLIFRLIGKKIIQGKGIYIGKEGSKY